MKISCFDCPFFYDDDYWVEVNCNLGIDLSDSNDPECTAPETCPLAKKRAVVVTYTEDKGFQIDY